MTLHINDGGTWRDIQSVYVNDLGTWRTIQEVYVNDAGTWRSVYSAETATLSDRTASAVSTGTATAVYLIDTDKDINATVGTNTIVDVDDWLGSAGSVSNYEVRVDITSGTLGSGTTGAWQSCSTIRTWTVSRPSALGSGTTSAVGTIQIRRASDATVVASATITWNATVP
jgi:hypothetical protein